MMSSVIPARLQFQCGHAALVTLPRVKGESSAQRNERIAREKSAALARQCDFCGPAVQVALSTPAGANGNHMLAAELTAPEVEAVVIEPVVELEEVLAVDDETVALVEEPIVVVEEPVVVVEEPVVVVVEEPVIVIEEEPVGIIAEVLSQEVEAQQAPAHKNGKVVLKPGRTRRAATSRREVASTAPTQRREFAVDYRTEVVVQAADIRDALRQAAALGAVDVVAAVRED